MSADSTVRPPTTRMLTNVGGQYCPATDHEDVDECRRTVLSGVKVAAPARGRSASVLNAVNVAGGQYCPPDHATRAFNAFVGYRATFRTEEPSSSLMRLGAGSPRVFSLAPSKAIPAASNTASKSDNILGCGRATRRASKLRIVVGVTWTRVAKSSAVQESK